MMEPFCTCGHAARLHEVGALLDGVRGGRTACTKANCWCRRYVPQNFSPIAPPIRPEPVPAARVEEVNEASEFCQAMRRRRRAMGLTLEQTAAELGVHSSTVASWETGRCAPSLDSLDGWARALNLAVVLVPAAGDEQ